MAIPSIKDLIKYSVNTLTGANWNANLNQIVKWFTDGTADVSFKTIQTSGSVNIGGALSTTGNVSIGGTLTISGASILLPTGSVIPYGGDIAPDGYIFADGSAISRITYNNLYLVYGTTWGVGDGTTTFNIPDLRASGLSGVGTSTKFTENETVALAEVINDRIQGHKHAVNAVIYGTTLASGASFAAGSADLLSVSVQNPTTDGVNGTPRTGASTRSKSTGINFIVKY